MNRSGSLAKLTKTPLGFIDFARDPLWFIHSSMNIRKMNLISSAYQCKGTCKIHHTGIIQRACVCVWGVCVWVGLCLKAVLYDLRVERCHILQLRFPVSTRHDKPSYSSFVCPVKRQTLVVHVTFYILNTFGIQVLTRSIGL